MIRFFGRRSIQVVPVLIGVSVIVFITIKLIPGDPVASLLGPTSTAATRAALSHHLGLDRPLPLQYLQWLANALHGDLGRSIARSESVAPMVTDALANTLLLAGAAALLAITGGVALGAVSAVRRQRFAGRVASSLSVAAVSAPQYSVALVLLVLLVVERPLLPSSGIHDAVGGGGPIDLLRHLALPALAAALAPMGVIARMFRASLTDVLRQDFVVGMRASGLPRAAIARHAFHNTVPALLTITGLQLGYLLGGVVFVETIFAWPGLGLLVFQSISQRDLPVIEAGVLLSALAFVTVNLAVDVTHAAIDPRIRQ